jgi:hypothetical protein
MALDRSMPRGLASRLFPRGSAQALSLVRAAWPLAVGPELARRTEILALEGTTLRIRVPDASWRQVLHRMQGEILGRLKRVAEDVAPHRLGFTEGAVEMPPPVREEPQQRNEPSPLPAAIREQALAIQDPEIREGFLRSAASYLERSRRHA